MRLLSRISTWWRAVSQGRELDRQIDEELNFHIESYSEDLIREGLPHDEAMRRARAELGSVSARKENCRSAWGTRIVDELFGDLRFAVRMLAKSPGLTAIAITSLALYAPRSSRRAPSRTASSPVVHRVGRCRGQRLLGLL
jgi:hypothetical protein